MAEPKKANVDYDLSPRVCRYLDNHLALPVLQFVKELGIYEKKQISRAIVDNLRHTYLINPALEAIKEASDAPEDVKKEIEAKQETLETLMRSLEGKSNDLLEIVRNEAEVDQLIADGEFNADHLKSAYGITSDTIEAFFQYARLMFQSGSYPDSNLILFYYRGISPDQEKLLSCYWGKVAAQLLTLQTNESVINCWTDMQMLQKLIDEKEESVQGSQKSLQILQLRTWLLHWSLFLFFKKGITAEPEETRNPDLKVPPVSDMQNHLMKLCIEFFTQENHLNTIQINSIWLLRYAVAAAIINKASKSSLRTILRALSQSEACAKDPITSFLVALMGDFDFNVAMEELNKCEAVFATDYFLHNFYEEFISNARTLFFETYCRIHASLDISWLGSQLGLEYDDAETWVVNLIKEAKLDAKIDSEKKRVRMGYKMTNPYQQTIDMTKDLAFRTYRLSSGLSAP